MTRSAFPIAIAIAGILAGRGVLAIDKVLDAKAAPAAPVVALTAGTQAAYGRAQGLPGF